ncbi:hypothetical protein D0T53_06505 [Dysgonomonas sp. 216]|uniref:hypothetical protein n=1 Tax=Dysgonomonas sp. 216 TaxID=2302934 RepID=UPI0013D61E22|nr:hypothetical protein [Dysgonomonas sp. 216]NDW18565.1 hypothetical protein [Dysgonomonas sp. 216]
MNHNLQIQKILLEVDKANNLDDKITLLKQAINIADANNDVDWGYDLRMDIIYQEKGTAHCIESIPAFTWILDTVDANPDLFEDNNIMLEYKWMVAAALRNSSFSVAQIEHIREDFKRRMIKNGQGTFTYNLLMMQWYMQTGEYDMARRYQALKDKDQPDEVSFCKACWINLDSELELLSGNTEKALTIADDLFTKRDTCKYEPFNTLSFFAYQLAQQNNDRAKAYLTDAENELSQVEQLESYMLLNISYMIYCASIYDENGAWMLFEKFADWSIGAEDYFTFYFSANMLRLTNKEGIKSLNLSARLPYFSKNGEYNLLELNKYFYNTALALATKFDGRNGNNFFTETLDKLKK